MIRITFLLIALSLPSFTRAQDLAYAKKIIDTLASPAMQGRGYVNNGDRIASAFIEQEMKSIGLAPLFAGNSYFQSFKHDVNIFADEPLLKFDAHPLVPGKDYIIHPYSGQISGSFATRIIKANDVDNLATKLSGANPSKTAVILYAETADDFKKVSTVVGNCLATFNVVILVNPSKLTWSVSDEAMSGKAIFEVRKEAFDAVVKKNKVKIACRPFLKNGYESRNVAGYIQGQIKDTFLLVTAHYDHLGKMGSALFPGASDNASGMSMMLNLANYYASNIQRPKYTLVFVAFAAEEAGLKGSKYFVENPPMALANIRFVFNIDLMGGGTVGSTIVNGSLFENEFKRIEKINTDNRLLGVVKKRGKAANSDHYWFTEKGVPAFFMYAEGGVTQYHDVNDTRENLPLTEYKDLFTLIRLFLDGF